MKALPDARCANCTHWEDRWCRAFSRRVSQRHARGPKGLCGPEGRCFHDHAAMLARHKRDLEIAGITDDSGALIAALTEKKGPL